MTDWVMLFDVSTLARCSMGHVCLFTRFPDVATINGSAFTHR